MHVLGKNGVTKMIFLYCYDWNINTIFMYVIDRYIFYNVHESEVCKCQTFDTGAWYLIQSGVKMNFVLTSYPEVNSYPVTQR